MWDGKIILMGLGGKEGGRSERLSGSFKTETYMGNRNGWSEFRASYKVESSLIYGGFFIEREP